MSWILSRVNAALQRSAGVFSSQTTSSQVNEELNKLSTNIAALTALLEGNNFSLIAITTKNLPQGIAVGTSFMKATSAIKNLTGPISPADADEILNNFRAVQTNTLAFVALYKTQSSSYDKFMPGMYKFGLDTLLRLFNSLSNALENADPSSISPETIQRLQSSVNSSATL